MKRIVHAVAGSLALMFLAAFWLSSAVSELSGRQEVILAVKTAILYAMPVLILCLAATGASGMALGGKWRHSLVDAKKRRMALAARNGLFVLVPSAIFLWWKAQAGAFDTPFFVVQAIELLCGAGNVTLLALNIRDGLKLRSPRKHPQG